MSRPIPGATIRITADVAGTKRILRAKVIAHRGERWSEIRIDVPHGPSKITMWRI